jgi:hypothetical protein
MRLLSVGQLGPAGAGPHRSIAHTGQGDVMERSKLKLSLDALHVESFATNRAVTSFGTVRAHDQETDFNPCGISNPCTTDGQATIDAALCGQSYVCEGTLGGTTCARTGRCCPGTGPTLDRTLVCCQYTTACG